MGRYSSPSDYDEDEERNPIRLMLCERCRIEPLSLPEFDVLCAVCRNEDAEAGLQAIREAQQKRGAA
jgi:hypothetical protein